MFDYLKMLEMIGTHDQRVVKNTKHDDFILDTCYVTDRDWNYETAVQHKAFNNGDWIILEGTYTKEEAIKQHDVWLTRLLDNSFETLTDAYSGEVFNRDPLIEIKELLNDNSSIINCKWERLLFNDIPGHIEDLHYILDKINAILK